MRRTVIRVLKKDSAFVYAILESLEGMASYSTLSDELGRSNYRDLELLIPLGYSEDVDLVLEGLSKKIPLEVIYNDANRPKPEPRLSTDPA